MADRHEGHSGSHRGTGKRGWPWIANYSTAPNWQSAGVCRRVGYAARSGLARRLRNRFHICSSAVMCVSNGARPSWKLGSRSTAKEETEMSETSKCRRCEQTIFWHKSKAGKSYPCDSEDRKDFHQCSESSTSK